MQAINRAIRYVENIVEMHIECFQQISVVLGLIGITGLGIFIRPGTNCAQYGRLLFVLSFGLVLGVLFMEFFILRVHHDAFRTQILNVRYHWKCILLVTVCLCIAVSHTGDEPRWDGAYLYHYIYSLYFQGFQGLFQDIQTFQFCGHLSMMYILLNVLGGLFFGNLSFAMTFINITLYGISVLCVYSMIRKTGQEKKDGYTRIADRNICVLTNGFGVSKL